MNILIAPNSMKGSLNAEEFAAAIEKGFRKTSLVFNFRKVPIADGGDYAGPVLNRALSAQPVSEWVSDPRGRPVKAQWGIAGRTAIIEMASASGMRLLKSSELNPEKATSYGTGQLIRSAVRNGCTEIILGVGGSATIDGGIGMMEALGFSFFDKEGNSLPGKVGSLPLVNRIAFPGDWPSGIQIKILSDVSNPLLGENGAAAVFGPQKGADPGMIARIEAGLTHWCHLLGEMSGGKVSADSPGMGAAGGISSGLVALLNAVIVPGAAYILELTGMEDHIRWADQVITGEGKLDVQSLNRKAPAVLAEKASLLGKPVFAICGIVQPEATSLFQEVFPVCVPPLTVRESMEQAEMLVISVSGQLACRLISDSPETKQLHGKLTEAEKLINSHHRSEAEQLLSTIEGDSLSGYWFLKGIMEQQIHQWGEAINYFRKCLDLDPDNFKASAEIEICLNILNFRNPDQFNP